MSILSFSGNSEAYRLQTTDMKRKLLTQMGNEWRDNVWMVVALMVVTAAVWLLLVLLWGSVKSLFEPRGFDVRNVYSLTIKTIDPESPHYIPEEEDSERKYSDLKNIVDRLKAHPAVEYVGVHENGVPYQLSFWGNRLVPAEWEDSIKYNGNLRTMTPEMVKVIGVESLDGVSADKLAEMLRRGEILVSNSKGFEKKRSLSDFKGHKFYMGKDSATVYRVGDLIRSIKRTDFEFPSGTIIKPMSEDRMWGDVAVRVKPGMARVFEEDFLSNESLRKAGNVYLSEFKSLEQMRDMVQRENLLNVRKTVFLIAFVLITIFLGLMGTFWFRVQQRVGEIAIRMVSGAKKREIFSRIISEGLLLLMVAVVIDTAVLLPTVARKYVAAKDLEWTVCLLSEVGAVVLVALGIVASLWYPARRAMRIEPALAMRAE